MNHAYGLREGGRCGLTIKENKARVKAMNAYYDANKANKEHNGDQWYDIDITKE
jgi:hypothetical protein